MIRTLEGRRRGGRGVNVRRSASSHDSQLRATRSPGPGRQRHCRKQPIRRDMNCSRPPPSSDVPSSNVIHRSPPRIPVESSFAKYQKPDPKHKPEAETRVRRPSPDYCRRSEASGFTRGWLGRPLSSPRRPPSYPSPLKKLRSHRPTNRQRR